MDIVKCCKEISNSYNGIFLADKELKRSDNIELYTPCYCTGEEAAARNIPIVYCPFCGKKIVVI